MKSLACFLFVFLNFTPILSQIDISTSGDNSPAVIARNFSVTYGVRADAIEAILWIYEAEGYDMERRKRATEQILREYAETPEKKQKATELSEASLRKIGIDNAPKITNALEWDLFAKNHYLSTTGFNSPAVMAKGDVNIWYGIPPKALRALAVQLEKNKTDISSFETKLADQVKKYEELKTELETYGGKEEIYRQAEALLEEGKLEEAEKLIESDYFASKKRQAYKGYVFGKTKALLLKYKEAALGFKDAVFMDSGNVEYHYYYANNETTLAHYDEAIRVFEIALGLDTLFTGKGKYKAELLSNLGLIYYSKSEYDKAILHHEKALQVNLKIFGENHLNVAHSVNSLGIIWSTKGEYDKAIFHYEKALQINLKVFGEGHPSIIPFYLSIGQSFITKGECDKAIAYYEKALQIILKVFGESHPNVADILGYLGRAWTSKEEYDKAIAYFIKALEIDIAILGEQHPNVARDLKGLGWSLASKGEYDKAISYYEKALRINLKVFGEDHPDVATNYCDIGTTWASKGEYDKAISCYEKALRINLKVFGESHLNVATVYTSIGTTWASKGEYDKAISYHEKALRINLKVFGENHQFIVLNYNNLGLAWNSKGEFDKAIEYFEKALEINLAIFGEWHTNIAMSYQSLGMAWGLKGELDKAIEYMEKAQLIYLEFFELTHPNHIAIANNLGAAANMRGRQFDDQKEYENALPYFQKALKNAEISGNIALSLTCLNNIGAVYKHTKNYEQGLFNLNAGIKKAAELHHEIDIRVTKEFTPDMLNDPDVQSKIIEMKNYPLIRRMHYHKVGCLKGLKRDKEAEALAKQLWEEGIKSNDMRLLEDLQKDGYNFRP